MVGRKIKASINTFFIEYQMVCLIMNRDFFGEIYVDMQNLLGCQRF